MSTVKWTDEAIERGLEYCRRFEIAGQNDNTSEQLKRALLEIRRMREWAKCGIAIGAPQDQREALREILNGDPAPTDEQENKR